MWPKQRDKFGMTGDPLIRVSLTKAFPHHESSVPAADRKTMAYSTPAGPLAFTFLSLRGTSQNDDLGPWVLLSHQRNPVQKSAVARCGVISRPIRGWIRSGVLPHPCAKIGQSSNRGARIRRARFDSLVVIRRSGVWWLTSSGKENRISPSA